MRADASVRSFILRTFVDQGRPPSPVEIAAQHDLTPAEVNETLDRLAEAHVVSLAPGSHHIWMANPFSAVPTSFRVIAGERSWWGNCIWDGLGILAMMNLDGRVETACPDCGEPLTVETHGDELGGDAGVVHFSVPAARWWDNIGFT